MSSREVDAANAFPVRQCIRKFLDTNTFIDCHQNDTPVWIKKWEDVYIVACETLLEDSSFCPPWFKFGWAHDFEFVKRNICSIFGLPAEFLNTVGLEH